MTITSSILLILIVGATIVCPKIEAISFEDDADFEEDEGGDGSFSDFETFEFAGFSVDVSRKHTVSKDLLKTIKVSSRYKVKTPYSGNETVFTFKNIARERVESCARCMLLKPEAKKFIDCRTKDALILDSLTPDIPVDFTSDDVDTDSDDIAEKFVVLFNLVFIRESSGKHDMNHEYKWFPLRRDVTERNIKAILETNNVENGFSSPTNFGFHVETSFRNEITGKRPVVCTAEVFASFNTSKPLIFGPRLFSRENDAFSVIETSWRDGLILNIQNGTCYMSGFTLFTLGAELTFIKKQDFPFITGNTRLWFEPSENNLLDITTNISQEKKISQANTKSEFPYATTMVFKSSSKIIPFMNFDSKKVRNHESDDQGVEDWLFGMAPYILSLESAWNKTVSILIAKLSTYDSETISRLKDREEVLTAMQHIGKLFFLNDIGKDNINITLQLDKSLLGNLLDRNLIESFFNSMSSNDKPQSTRESQRPEAKNEL